jgi:hypothetical protein
MSSSQANVEVESQTTIGFCIYINTLHDGPVPVERTAGSNPFTYPTRQAAEREIAEDTLERIRQFLAGERDFEDAMTVEEYVVEVDVLPDGSTVDESGNHFGKDNW